MADLKSPPLALPLASPVDRLAAFALDLLILGLAISFLTAPLQAQVQLEELLQHPERVEYYGIFALLAGFLIVVIYSSVSTIIWHASPGQKFLKLRVVDVWTLQSASVPTLILRAILRCVCVPLVVPLMGLFTDSRRRSFYDRMTDTIVLAVDEKAVPAPLPTERNAVRTFGYGIVLGLLAFTSVTAYEFIEGHRDLSRPDENRFSSCEAVTAAAVDWPGGLSESQAKIDIALTLFAAGRISEECLDTEATALGRDSFQSERYQLAKAFVHADDPTLSDAYLAEVCAKSKSSESCFLTEILQMMNEGAHEQAWLAFQEALKKENTNSLVKSLANSLTVVWAIREAEHEMKFDDELHLIKSLRHHRALAEFLEVRQTVALWGLNRRSEARVLADGVLPYLDNEAAGEFAQWVCQREVEDQCPVESPVACDVFKNHFGTDSRMKGDGGMSLTYVRARECDHREAHGVRDGVRERNDDDFYDSVEKEVAHSGVREIVDAVRLFSSHRIEAKQRLLELIQRESLDEDIQQEAFQRLVDMVSTTRELSVLEGRWAHTKIPSWSWRSVGHHLFDRYRSLAAHKDAVRVGEILLGYEPRDRRLREGLMVSAYRDNDFPRAFQYLKQNERQQQQEWRTQVGPFTDPNPFPRRAPASVETNDLEAIVRQLHERFERQ